MHCRTMAGTGAARTVAAACDADAASPSKVTARRTVSSSGTMKSSD